MQTFAEYCHAQGISIAEAARQLGEPYKHVRHWAAKVGTSDFRRPRDDAMPKIEAWSKGAVGPASFYPAPANGVRAGGITDQQPTEDAA